MTAVWYILGAVSLAVIALASFAAFACVLGTLRSRGWPATPPAPRCPPSAAPGHTHDSGGLAHVSETYRCGCVLHYDGPGRLVGADPAGCVSGVDAELRGMS